MKRTAIECDVCGDDIVCMDGVLEIKAVQHVSQMTKPVKYMKRVHVCPFCREKIRGLVLGEEKPVNVAEVMGGKNHAE